MNEERRDRSDKELEILIAQVKSDLPDYPDWKVGTLAGVVAFFFVLLLASIGLSPLVARDKLTWISVIIAGSLLLGAAAFFIAAYRPRS